MTLKGQRRACQHEWVSVLSCPFCDVEAHDIQTRLSDIEIRLALLEQRLEDDAH